MSLALPLLRRMLLVEKGCESARNEMAIVAVAVSRRVRVKVVLADRRMLLAVRAIMQHCARVPVRQSMVVVDESNRSITSKRISCCNDDHGRQG